MCDFNQATSLLSVLIEWPSKLLVPAIALAGAIYTAMQYRRVQQWRSSDQAEQLIADLTKDEELAFACQALDWGVGPLIVPTRYRALLVKPPADPKAPTPKELGQVIIYDAKILLKALEVYLAFDYRENPQGLVYRYCFDRLFTHLTNINRLLDDGQISISNLDSLKYWLEKIFQYPYTYDIKPDNEAFQPYIRFPAFGYLGIVELGRRLGVTGWDKPPPNLEKIWETGQDRQADLTKTLISSPDPADPPLPDAPLS